MIHRIDLGVVSEDSLEFWEGRLRARGYEVSWGAGEIHFTDYDGLALSLVVTEGYDPPLRAEHPEIPEQHAIIGIEAARAYAPRTVVAEEEPLLTETLGFTYEGEGEYRLDGELRHFRWDWSAAPGELGIQGAGSVHHIAWACRDDEQLAWQQRVREVGVHVTDVLDRQYFTSIYFREPRHVLFEIATLSPGFAIDEDPANLGEELRLPGQHEHLRTRLGQILTPIENPRAAASRPK